MVLSASFDPGWTARVDGRPAKVFPVAPALVATSVPAGVHTVVFRYVGFSSYLVLFLLSGLSVVSLAIVDWKRRRGHRGGPDASRQLRPGGYQAVGSDELPVARGGGTEAVLEGWSAEDAAGDGSLGYDPAGNNQGMGEVTWREE